MVCIEVPRRTIEGGFVLVPVADLMSAWHACRARSLGIGDFRTWLACHEMVARRGHLDDGRAPAYGFVELVRILGVTERRSRASIRRLVAAGLIRWAADSIEFLDQGLVDPDLAQTIGGGRGHLAIPRRMLRYLAAGARPALIAAALGVLLRCLSRRRDGFDGRGRVKASWVAEAFGVSLRQVKFARLELVDIGWIDSEPAAQWTEQRWGRAFRIRLDWSPAARSDGATLTPPTLEYGASLSPPDLQTQIPSGRNENQEPPSGRSAGTGVEVKVGEGDKPAPSPTLDNVRIEDLADTGRTLKLFAQAVTRGLAEPSENDRHRFVALAEHCRSHATRNAGGLFAALVRRRAWAFATQPEEDRARWRLREYEHGTRIVATQVGGIVAAQARGVVASGTAIRPPGRVSSFVPNAKQAEPTELGDLLAKFRPVGGLS